MQIPPYLNNWLLVTKLIKHKNWKASMFILHDIYGQLSVSPRESRLVLRQTYKTVNVP